MITNGKYKAKATGKVVLGRSAKEKTPFIELYFQIAEGENKGGECRWTGYFGPKSAERTVQSLQYCGWQGENLGEFADGELHGLDASEVIIDVELETWKNEEGEDRTSPRVKWVNSLLGGGGYLNVENAMSKEAASDFGETMRGLVLKMQSKKGAAAPPAEPKKGW